MISIILIISQLYGLKNVSNLQLAFPNASDDALDVLFSPQVKNIHITSIEE